MLLKSPSHNKLPTPTKTPNALEVLIKITRVLVKTPLFTITPFIDDINQHNDHLLNHALIVIEADHDQILTYTPITNANPLSV